MAATSTYINLSNSVLLEYQYRDQASIVDEFTTTQAPWFLMDDAADKSTLIFNNDDSTNITGNVRTRMGCSTEPTTATYGYLKLNQIMALNDYDPQLTNSVSLPVSFSPMEVVAYDVVRIHLVQGFNFENNEGFYFRLGFNDNAGNVVRHLNLSYRKSDNYAQLNSSPFILGGKYYASYIEIKVPALYNLQDEWYQAISTGSPTVNLPSSRLTNGNGPSYSSLITTEFGWIVQEKVVNNQTYFNTYELIRIDLPVKDQFNDLSAVIQESTNGDYLELYAAYSGNIIDNFIGKLNNVPGNDYIILHELHVFEYVWNGGANPVWIETSKLEFVQDSEYEDPILYRPIIQNNGAVTYRIDYTIRLFNREDQTSIWKEASANFGNPLKYAKSLQKINLGINPIQPKIYNKVYDKSVQMYGNNDTGNSLVSNLSEYKEFVTSFLSINQIMISAQNAYMKKDAGTGKYVLSDTGDSSSQIIYAQGLGKINMTQGDTYIKFVMYKGSAKHYDFVDLSGLGILKLNFYADSGEIVSFNAIDSTSLDDQYALTTNEGTQSINAATGEVTNSVSQTINSSSGECLFKVNSKDAQRISEYQSKQFTVTAWNGDSESQIYTGTFVTVGNQVSNFQDKKIASLQKQIEEWTQKFKAQVALTTLANNTITGQSATIENLNNNLASAQSKIDLKIQEYNAEVSNNIIDEEEKNALEIEIAQLEAANEDLQASVEIMEIVDASCPSCDNVMYESIAEKDASSISSSVASAFEE